MSSRPGGSRLCSGCRRGRTAGLLLAFPLALIAILVLAPAASAHPLGNFTVNSYSALRVEPDAIAVQLVVDSAEIPTVQQFPDANSAGGVAPSTVTEYAEQECARLQPGVQLSVDDASTQVTVGSSELEIVPGEAGLHTMRLTCELRTTDSVDTVGHQVQYVDQNSLERTGWREITATGDGVEFANSTAPSESVSDELTDYPADLLSSPLDDRSATVQVTPGDGVVSGSDAAPETGGVSEVDGFGGLTRSFTELISARDLGMGVAIIALLLSVGLGALHAFAPGHGKTLMAAYLLGRHSSLRQVAIIGTTVTLTHTAGVLVLGVVLSAVALTSPTRIYGWLGIASGVLLIAIGASLLRQARRRHTQPTMHDRAAELVGAGAGGDVEVGHRHGHEHGHDHEHAHEHEHTRGDGHGHHHESHGAGQHDHSQHHPGHGVTHSHGWGGTHTHPAPETSARGMIAVGFAGGMVPSPSALIVLIGGIALGRAWFGVLLVLGYGIGMALALIGTGLALAHARDLVERWAVGQRSRGGGSSLLLRAARALPMIAAALVIVVGIGLMFRSSLML